MSSRLPPTLWNDLKTHAAQYAASDRPLPVDEECERWLLDALASHGLHASERTIEFYSSELCALIEDYRKARTGLTASKSR